MIKYSICLLAVTLFFLTLPADSHADCTKIGEIIPEFDGTAGTATAEVTSEIPAEMEIVTETESVTEADTESLTVTETETDTDTDVDTVTETESTTETAGETDTAENTAAEDEPCVREYKYSTDVSKYLEYIDPEDDTPYLILANRDNPIDGYVPANLVSKSGMNGNKMEKAAAEAFRAMYLEMKAAKVKLPSVASTYRPYDQQKRVHAAYLATEKKAHPDLSDDEIEKIVCTYSAPAGTSEHQTGLAMDLSPLKNSFSKTATYKWLKKYAYKFGFIERFPKDKTEITGYNWEPWHWRFVGRDAATYIHENGLCLEEYIAIIGQTDGTCITEPDELETNFTYGE